MLNPKVPLKTPNEVYFFLGHPVDDQDELDELNWLVKLDKLDAITKNDALDK